MAAGLTDPIKDAIGQTLTSYELYIQNVAAQLDAGVERALAKLEAGLPDGVWTTGGISVPVGGGGPATAPVSVADNIALSQVGGSGLLASINQFGKDAYGAIWGAGLGHTAGGSAALNLKTAEGGMTYGMMESLLYQVVDAIKAIGADKTNNFNVSLNTTDTGYESQDLAAIVQYLNALYAA